MRSRAENVAPIFRCLSLQRLNKKWNFLLRLHLDEAANVEETDDFGELPHVMGQASQPLDVVASNDDVCIGSCWD